MSATLATDRVASGPVVLVGRRVPLRTVPRTAGHRPVVTKQPSNQSVTAGRTAIFTAAAAGKPRPAVQWERSANKGRTWERIRGARKATYAFEASTSDNGDEYRADFTSSVGGALTRAAKLRVAASGKPPHGPQPSAPITTSTSPLPSTTPPSTTPPSTTPSPQSASPQTSVPVVTTQPLDVTVQSGETATFAAAASGYPAPTVQWFVSTNDGANWSQISGATSATYSFTAISSQNGDLYVAMFTNSVGFVDTQSVSLTVTPVVTGPQVTEEPQNASVSDGEVVSFTAAASGYPAPSVQWEVSTDGGLSWGQVADGTSDTYSFTADTSESGYEYMAVFSNSGGVVDSSPATLTVTSGPAAPQVTTQPANETVAASGAASFSAAAFGNPAPTVQWQVSEDGGNTWSYLAGETETTLSFTASSQEFYEYRAVFTNSLGTATSAAATLTIAQQTGNWSGYAVSGSAFTNVSGSWTVPTITCSGETTYSSQWLGIDGYGDSTVEQDGTEADCMSGQPSYDAWYEMYGDQAVNSGYEMQLSSSDPVSPGDQMTASVTTNGSSWTLAIADQSKGWNFSTTIVWSTPSRISAEWITERPGVNGDFANLSRFSTMNFAGSGATDGSASGPITSFSFEPLEMVNGNDLLAAPGALDSSGREFLDTWYASN